MTVSAAPTIFDIFNARPLSPKEVASSFVPPPHFADLAKATHTLVLGPRGSGKTTLLKMLQPAALEAWKHPGADQYRSGINFTGVFVATDINWNEQIKALGDGKLDPETHRHFAKAAFTTEILQALIESMIYRAGGAGAAPVAPHRRVRLSESDQAVIARELCESWHMDKVIATLEGIKFGLARRLSKIRELASQESCRSESGRLERIAEIEFLHLDFLSAAGVAVETFNAKAKDRNGRWAFLFDELELAPDWIRGTLIRYLRSVDQRFLFKISLSPYSVDLKKELEGPDAAAPKQDFESIRLWYVHKEAGYPFCRELLKSMLSAKELPDKSPEQIFGTSAFVTESEEWTATGTAYRWDSSLGRQITQLAERDQSFRHYLQIHGIDPKSMHKIGGTKRAAELRKARSVIALRTYFRGAGAELRQSRTQRRRSRKVPTLYGGGTSLFSMVEGNPRWFIAIVGGLLNATKQRPVSKALQVRHVLDAVGVFRAMLSTIPCGQVGGAKRGLLSLLDPVGDYFAAAAIDGAFDPDPPSSFTVDSRTTDEDLRALGMALNAGAIVYAPDEGEVGLLENLRGKRFRLSYILAPYYFVPLVLGRPVSLRTILQRTGKRPFRAEPTLFAPLEDSNE